MMEAQLIAALADAYHTDAMVFVTDTHAVLHTSLSDEYHDIIVTASRSMEPGFYRLAPRDGVELGEMILVSDADAIAVLVERGMIGRVH